MDDLLKHPLVLLFVGAVVTGLLIPRLMRRSQDRQKELEIKTKLVGDIAECTMTVLKFIEAVRVLRTWLPEPAADDAGSKHDVVQNQYRSAFDAMNLAAQRFAVQSAVIGTSLEAYLPDSEVPGRWKDFSDSVSRLYALEGIHDEDRANRYRDELRQRVSALIGMRPVGEDWLEIRDRILEVKAGLIKNVLHSRFSVFSW